MKNIYFFDESYFTRSFKNRWIFDCAVVDRKTISFILFNQVAEDDGNRVLGTVTFGESANWDATKYTGFLFPMLGAAPNLGKTSVMLGCITGVAVHGDAGDDMWPEIPRSERGPLDTGPKGMSTIDGKLYVCGGWRHVCYLDDKQKWVSIRENLPDPPNPKKASRFGFSAIAGFSAKDIYAVGGEGDIWRYDGKIWRQCPSPTNMQMESVCCAGDGQVYIGLQSGGLMRGREDEWEVIHEDRMTVPFKDIVWYQDRLWCTSEYGLWTLDGKGKLVDADVPTEVRACAGNLSTADGVMLIAGYHGAAIHDGKAWHRLV
jgi:hypothetical protein